MSKVDAAVKALKSGQLTVLPTETVYGLFADALNEAAVERLYAVKGRPVAKALNLNVADIADILRFSQKQPAYLEKLIGHFLPGPLTIILEASPVVPAWVHVGKTTIGFRMPQISATLEIIRQVGVLVGPSANVTGDSSPRFFSDLKPEILSTAAVSLQDDSISGLDTTILDLTTQPAKILRQGAITREQLLEKIPELSQIERQK
jgi:L-threonylcarbamoyladenylate synthase